MVLIRAIALLVRGRPVAVQRPSPDLTTCPLSPTCSDRIHQNVAALRPGRDSPPGRETTGRPELSGRPLQDESETPRYTRQCRDRMKHDRGDLLVVGRYPVITLPRGDFGKKLCLRRQYTFAQFGTSVGTPTALTTRAQMPAFQHLGADHSQAPAGPRRGPVPSLSHGAPRSPKGELQMLSESTGPVRGVKKQCRVRRP